MTAAAREDRSGILVVEDQILLAMQLSMSLERVGFDTVGPCSNVDDALRTLAHETPQAAILDVNLGSGTTSEAIAAELERRDVPFAFLTGYSQDIPIVQMFPNALFEGKPVNDLKLQRLMDELMKLS